MQRKSTFLAATAVLIGIGALAVGAGFGQPEGEPEMQLPPGWTMEDMMAYVTAGTPGEEHAWLAESAGTWHGKGFMWMGPEGESIPFESTMTITAMMDGRYVTIDYKGEMPGMGEYHGFGITGYDNIAGHFVGVWIDSYSTGFMNGTATKSDDGTLTWSHSYTCPIHRKPTAMREIDRITGENTRTMEMHGTDPITGKEYKMMEVDFTRG
ncbi:MAG: DUF1579 domain-containing protein [Phycisphaerales bacterium]|nr:DUF1579 domain-containing protein [Planctomycetota bacterium]MCH8507672.1 DUF1579 domain-containing protein [Phycisphaerales bacterium]